MCAVARKTGIEAFSGIKVVAVNERAFVFFDLKIMTYLRHRRFKY
jgi:hypothetical protein